MLKKLAENHDQWLNIAFKLCKCHDLSNDLVKNMYLKLHDYDKEIEPGYIFRTIRSIYIDGIRKNKVDLDVEYKELQSDDLDIDSFIIIEKQYETIEKVKLSLKWHEQKIIELSNEIGIRPLSRALGCSKETIVNTRNKLKWQSQNLIAFRATDQKKK